MNKADTTLLELESLLSESPERAARRAATAFDDIAKDSPLVLRGAGGLGRIVAQGLQKVGRTPVAFVDSNSALWGKKIDGVPVLSPAAAAERYGNEATFLITIWRAGGGHREEHFRKELSELGCSSIASFALLFWKYPEIFLPYYCLDLPQRLLSGAADIQRVFSLWSDSQSQREYLHQLRWRLLLDFNCLSSPGSEDQYFPPNLYRAVQDEIYVDCGAFDGDTLQSFLRHKGAAFKRYVALEPDPDNFAKLQRYHSLLEAAYRPRIELIPIAASNGKGELRFNARGTASASASGVGNCVVPCDTLDNLLGECSVTTLKMDIEGAELSALEGAKGLLRQRPVLQICVYHQPQDLWKIPLFIHEHCADYGFYLRPHNEEGWDLICYAVPNERLYQ